MLPLCKSRTMGHRSIHMSTLCPMINWQSRSNQVKARRIMQKSTRSYTLFTPLFVYSEATTFTLHRVYEKQIGVKEIFERNMRKLLINFVDGYNITFLVVGSTPFNSHMLLLGAKKERIPIGINIGWMDAGYLFRIYRVICK